MGKGLLVLVLAASCSRSSEPAEHRLAAEAKRCAQGAELECARPIFTVDDLKASERYFEDKLGFKLDWEDGKPPDFASLTRSHLTVFLCERCQGTRGAWMYSVVRDVDKLHADLKQRGAIIARPPKDEPWGMREMHVADPDGNTIRFGSPNEH